MIPGFSRKPHRDQPHYVGAAEYEDGVVVSTEVFNKHSHEDHSNGCEETSGIHADANGGSSDTCWEELGKVGAEDALVDADAEGEKEGHGEQHRAGRESGKEGSSGENDAPCISDSGGGTPAKAIGEWSGHKSAYETSAP